MQTTESLRKAFVPKTQTRCNAELHIADDFGDNWATMHCSLESGHEGRHHEHFERGGTPVDLYWDVDERDK